MPTETHSSGGQGDSGGLGSDTSDGDTSVASVDEIPLPRVATQQGGGSAVVDGASTEEAAPVAATDAVARPTPVDDQPHSTEGLEEGLSGSDTDGEADAFSDESDATSTYNAHGSVGGASAVVYGTHRTGPLLSGPVAHGGGGSGTSRLPTPLYSPASSDDRHAGGGGGDYSYSQSPAQRALFQRVHDLEQRNAVLENSNTDLRTQLHKEIEVGSPACRCGFTRCYECSFMATAGSRLSCPQQPKRQSTTCLRQCVRDTIPWSPASSGCPGLQACKPQDSQA